MTPLDPGILRSILASPEDDTPRLIAADWLDDHGAAERAEFIRVQCALAVLSEWCKTQFLVLPESPRGQQIAALRCRERELLPLVSGYFWDGIGSNMLTWRRGFIEEIECTAPSFLANADAITTAHPVRRVRLTTWPELKAVYHGGDTIRQFHLAGRKKRTN